MVIAYGSRRRCWLNTSGTLFNVSKYFACGCSLSNNHDTKRTISPKQPNGSCVRLDVFGDFGDHAVVCCVPLLRNHLNDCKYLLMRLFAILWNGFCDMALFERFSVESLWLLRRLFTFFSRSCCCFACFAFHGLWGIESLI